MLFTDPDNNAGDTVLLPETASNLLMNLYCNLNNLSPDFIFFHFHHPWRSGESGKNAP